MPLRCLNRTQRLEPVTPCNGWLSISRLAIRDLQRLLKPSNTIKKAANISPTFCRFRLLRTRDLQSRSDVPQYPPACQSQPGVQQVSAPRLATHPHEV